MTDDPKKPPTLWGVWSEENEDPPEWFNTKEEAVDHAKGLVTESYGVRVHLLRAASVGTIEVPAIPVTTGEMTATKSSQAPTGSG